MKLNKLFAAFMLIAATVFVGCEPQNPPGPGNGQGGNEDTTVVTPGAPDTIGWNIPAEAITASEARALCEALPADQTTGTKYYVMGYIKKLHSANADGIATFGNASFYMEDIKGANSKDDFVAFQVMGLDGQKITNPDAVAVGDFVVVYGELVNFKGETPETVNKGAAHIWKSTNPALGGNGNTGNPTEVVGDGSFENPYTANDVLLLGNSNAGNYWVKAYIVGQINGKSISGAEFDAPFSGSSNDDGSVNNYNTNILIANSADEANSGNCVPVQLPSGALRTGLNLVQNPDMDGQEVLLYGSLEAYFGAAGIKSTSYAKVGDKEWGVNPNVEQKEPTAKVVTIKEFIAAPEYTESLVYYELTGVISGLSAGGNAVIYGNFDLTDETGTVYVYGLDKAFTAVGNTKADKSFGELGLKDGDKITLRGLRGSYNGKIEVMGAYFVKLISSGNENPNPGGNGDNNGDNNGNDDNTGTTPPEGAIVFDADTDKGNAGTDSNNATSYTITKDGVTITVSQGILGAFNGEGHYRIYKNQTLTVTSTVGNVKKVSFTCTANDDAKYGPGCFTWSTGDYTYSGPTGTWTGDAAEVVFTASSNQVRASQIVVEL